MFYSLYEDLKDPTLLKDILIMISLKIILGVGIYLGLLITGLEYPFNFQDFTDLYRTCSTININIGFAQLVCILGIQSIDQPIPIGISISLTLISFTIIYCAFFSFLNRSGQILFILMLVIHPYLLISTFRLTTDLFAMLAISITTYFMTRNIPFNKFFYVMNLSLIFFRYHLAVIFLPLFTLIAFEKWQSARKLEFFNIFAIVILILGLLSAFSYATMFTGNNKGFDVQTLILNTIYLLGFREMVGINGISAFLCCNILWHNIQFIVSMGLVILHLLGLIGIFKFSKVTNNKILIILIYLIPCILIVGHLRFLLPLIPLLLGGIAYLFMHNGKLSNYNKN